MIGTLRVEDATTDDAAAIRALPVGRSTAHLLDGDLTDASRPCLVARLDGEVVGAAFGMVLLDEGHVNDIAVAEHLQGQGVGALLLAALEDALTALGAVATTLEVRPTNAAARALYRRLGFVEEGRRRGYYPDGEDALILWRRPAPSAGPTSSGGTTASPAHATSPEVRP